MALIKCPECGKEVSDKAQSCINCGCPLAGINPSGSVSVAVNGPGMVQMYIFNMGCVYLKKSVFDYLVRKAFMIYEDIRSL